MPGSQGPCPAVSTRPGFRPPGLGWQRDVRGRAGATFSRTFRDEEGEVCRAPCTFQTRRFPEPRTRAPHAARRALAAGPAWDEQGSPLPSGSAPGRSSSPPPPPLPPLLSPSRAAGSANQLPARAAADAAAPRRRDLMRIHISRPSAGIRADPRRRARRPIYF